MMQVNKDINSLVVWSILLFSSYTCPIFAQQKVGVNTTDPQTTMEVKNTNLSNPSNETGVLIPRVNSLNTTDAKEVGLMVYYDAPTPADQGFYWWNGTTWRTFITTNTEIKQLYIAFAYTEDSFVEGDMTSSSSTDVRTIDFNTVATNDTPNYQISNGNLVVKKPGTYLIETVVYIEKRFASNEFRRDGLELEVLLNGNTTSVSALNTFDMKGTASYPAGGGNGVNPPTININIAGVLKLQTNDQLSLRVNRFYTDSIGGSIQINLNPDVVSTMSLRYLGQ